MVFSYNFFQVPSKNTVKHAKMHSFGINAV